jgi:flagellar capping protein FliD
VGDSSTPDYRISLRAQSLGDVDPQLLDATTSLTDATSKIAGVPVRYIVNNSNVTSTSDSRTISVANGLTLNVLPGATGTVDITVAPSSSALSSALANFASAYNNAADALAAQRGQSGGALVGDPLVQQLSEILSGVGTYSDASGTVSGLASLGLDLGSDGHLTFNQFTFAALGSKDADGLAAFLGSASGSGFLQTASDALGMVAQSDTGILAVTGNSIQSQISNLTDQIATQQDRVDRLQTQLQQQMSAADALIASMEQQYSYFSNMFSAMQTAAEQYK